MITIMKLRDFYLNILNELEKIIIGRISIRCYDKSNRNTTRLFAAIKLAAESVMPNNVNFHS